MARSKQYGRHSTRGLTLVELLVVMAVVSLLVSLSVAGVASFTSFASDALQRSTRDVFTVLKAARIYASTHSVNTAVVYTLDRLPATDPMTGNAVREIIAAAVMYRNENTEDAAYGLYLAAPGEQGEFELLETGVVIPLWDITAERNGTPYYFAGGRDIAGPSCQDLQNLPLLGMAAVQAIVYEDNGPVARTFAAHVFQPSGRMQFTVCDGSAPPERVEFFVAPSVTEDLGVRLVNPENTASERIYTPIRLYRSTGRVEIAS
ncbi:MAG: prepilin-type N-terminal cleavage/methylation domain-containing protein [Candidatus Hydrogenedentes bacterium]|nr:prepilin-type N-terminal cleavage/methylation domain-containing protein [Candidatus Hydrogenedentota bacterium]